MAWEHIAAGIGGGLSGLAQGGMFREESRLKEKAITSREEMEALKQEIKVMVAGIGADAKRDVATIQTQGRTALQSLINSGNLDVQELKNRGFAYVRQLANEGLLDQEELRQIGRLDLQKEITSGALKVQALRNQGAANVANIHGATSRDVANIQGDTARDTTGMRVNEDARQFDLSFSLKPFELETGRISATRPRTGNNPFADQAVPQTPTYQPTAPLPQPRPAAPVQGQQRTSMNPAGFMAPSRPPVAPVDVPPQTTPAAAATEPTAKPAAPVSAKQSPHASANFAQQVNQELSRAIAARRKAKTPREREQWSARIAELIAEGNRIRQGQ